MKVTSLIPKSWRKNKASRSSEDASSSSKQRNISETRIHFPSDSGSSTSSTLAEPVLKIRERSYSSDKLPGVRHDPFAQVHAPARSSTSMSPPNLQQGSGSGKHDHSFLDANVPVRLPYDPPREFAPHRPPVRLASFEHPRPPLQSTSRPRTSPHKSESPSPLKAPSAERHPPHSRMPAGILHSQKSMPELERTWKGFLDDVKENDESIRLDCEDAHHRDSNQRSIELYDLETSRRLEMMNSGCSRKSGERPSTSPASHKIRGRTRPPSRSESTSVNNPLSTSHSLYTLENRSAILPNEEPPDSSNATTHHQRDVSADFPLSLFPAPPPLIQNSTMKPRLPPESSASQLHFQEVDAFGPYPTSPLSSIPPHPPLPTRKRQPKPLDLGSFATTKEPLPSPLDSPSLITPITPRSPQSSHSHSTRTATSTSPTSILKKKSSRGFTNRTYTTSPPTPPTTPDYFGYPPSSEIPLPEYTPERPSLRPAYSSSHLRGSTTPPPGAHRATMSESVNPPSRKTDGKMQTISRPDDSMPRKPLQRDAYMYPRPAPEPTSQVQWGYAV